MKYTLLSSALLDTLSLSVCLQPTVVTVPASPVAVPGPAGATGANSSQGTVSYACATEKYGTGVTVIVMPAALAPAN
jgi:hypothetical protein